MSAVLLVCHFQSQLPFNGLQWNFVYTFMFPQRMCVCVWGARGILSLLLLRHRKMKYFTYQVKNLQKVLVLNFYADINGYQTINQSDFADPLTFPRAPPWCWDSWFFREALFTFPVGSLILAFSWVKPHTGTCKSPQNSQKFCGLLISSLHSEAHKWHAELPRYLCQPHTPRPCNLGSPQKFPGSESRIVTLKPCQSSLPYHPAVDWEIRSMSRRSIKTPPSLILSPSRPRLYYRSKQKSHKEAHSST